MKKIFNYESKKEPLHPLPKFIRRLGQHFLMAMALAFFSLALGIAGYYYFENFSFIDSLLNASMILGGMGPVNPLLTNNGKIFASFYSLYSGIIVLAVAGIIIAPVAHRVLHHFHADEGDH